MGGRPVAVSPREPSGRVEPLWAAACRATKAAYSWSDVLGGALAMLELSMEFNCDQCGRALALDAEHAGAAVHCPECGHVVVVPGGEPGVARESLTRATRACPACRAVVKRLDETCPQCRAWIGDGPPPELTARRQRQREHTLGRAAIRAGFADYALCTLIPPVGFCVGVVFLVRGLDRRGWVMLLYSLAAGTMGTAVAYQFGYLPHLGG